MMFVGHFQHLKNRPTCKEKWSSILVDFKNFFDYMFVTLNNEDYWSLSSQDKVSLHLPRFFNRSVYDMIHEFMGNRPIFTPPHV